MARMSRPIRRAFSLLEMVLALVLGMLLLAVLYQTLVTQVQFAQIGRDAITEAEMGRSILTRIADDVANQMPTLDPRVLPIYEDLPAEPAPVDPDAAPATTTPAAGTTPAAAPMVTMTPPTGIAFNVGVRGDATRLTLSIYRVQPASADAGMGVGSDLRRISYWLINNGDGTGGLARHETKLATAAEIDVNPVELPDQDKLIIAREVKDILFEYFDGKSWQPTWEGSLFAGGDGTTPQGAPAAIKITITLRSGRIVDGVPAAEGGTVYSQVVAIPAGNNFPTTGASETP